MASWEKCKNILLIRLDNMGDVIMNNAAFSTLRNHFSTSRITLLTSSMASPIVPYLGTIDETMLFDSPWMKNGDVSDQPASLLHLMAEVKAKQFDGCIIFNVYSQNILPAAMLAYLAEIPLRAAYCRENPYDLLTHWYPDPEPFSIIRHQIQRDLKLLEIVGISAPLDRLPTLQAGRRTLPATLGAEPVHLVPFQYTIIHLEVSEAKRQYPATNARELIMELLNQGETLLFTGQHQAPYLTACIADIRSPHLHDLRGCTSIPQLLALIQHAKGIVCVNTSVMHIACAYRRPTFALYANSNPQHSPWGGKSRQILFDIPEHLTSKNQIIAYVHQLQPAIGTLPDTAQLVAEYQTLVSSN